ncbi:lysine N(6)-hydroxylase/L-ornithine N(5)-oxygenase family protein [Paenibacillus sp. SYP-B4298]|uniref:lysine N(6)-hydroxylase/L-ornithine N(5)-oxygenase family protein n=1 Tax=Paenibacillus sp. SYP-B4298 TaxID=2996034 RepID=UPI0022DD0718|nr:SidA/IucD/PvdA family monooxygenase [Paenibacillus sp. SYP-B4298]
MPKQEDKYIKDNIMGSNKKIHDVIGVGLGPFNLSLAVAIQEEIETKNEIIEALFLERKREFNWHPDMMIEDTTMQVAFLKDLITMKNPKSKFTFLNYLSEKDRLSSFVNLRDFYPTRMEFTDYYNWAANQVRHQLKFGKEVISVTPQKNQANQVEILKLTVRDISTDRLEEYWTYNLVVATGSIPWSPVGNIQGRNVFHTADFLKYIKEYPEAEKEYKFVVVGSGQSAAEVVQYLLKNYKNAEITATMRQFAYRPIDASEFVNELYDPNAIDFFYNLPLDKRSELLKTYRHTNYASIDSEIISSIYKIVYSEKVIGKYRMNFKSFTELHGVEVQENGVIVKLNNLIDGTTASLVADAIILATGYYRNPDIPILDKLKEYFVKDDDGKNKINRDYSYVTSPQMLPGIFIQGFCEETHGVSDTNLSNASHRAADILNSILLKRSKYGYNYIDFTNLLQVGD